MKKWRKYCNDNRTRDFDKTFSFDLCADVSNLIVNHFTPFNNDSFNFHQTIFSCAHFTAQVWPNNPLVFFFFCMISPWTGCRRRTIILRKSTTNFNNENVMHTWLNPSIYWKISMKNVLVFFESILCGFYKCRRTQKYKIWLVAFLITCWSFL